MQSTVLVTLGASNEPPSEFRIFRAGSNDTLKGTFLFDAAAARSVMAEYQAHGVDLMIDYDHASLGVGIDPALSGRAAGWFQPTVRNGELWATNVRWTPAAAQALRAKEWKYMSPAFSLDKSGRITALINVALTNLPATRQLEPLVAASARGVDGTLEAIAMRSLTAEQRTLCGTMGCTATDFLAARRFMGRG